MCSQCARNVLVIVIIPASSVLEFIVCDIVSYEKARSQKSEVEPCRVISASALDDVASENACSC